MAVSPPQISEFAFGFSVTHLLVNCRVGTMSPWPVTSRRWRHLRHFPWWDKSFVEHTLVTGYDLSQAQAEAVTAATGAPFIPTQSLEKTFPVDMAMNANGIYYFLQFKRSTCVSANQGNLIEKNAIKAKHFGTPLYRVYFGGGKVNNDTKQNGDRDQRDNLEKLESSLATVNSAIVRYAAPAFHKLSELSQFQNGGLSALIDGRWPVVTFKASAFNLPDNKRHCVSFDGKSSTGYRYSSEDMMVPELSPLLGEIEKCSANAPPLSQSMKLLRELLDKLAIEMGLPQRPEVLSDREFLRIFGVHASRKGGEEQTGAMSFLMSTPMDKVQEAELAGAFRKILSDGDDEKAQSRMAFLNDFYGADYRCQQILGQPLMIGARPNPKDLTWGE